ncbi:MAG: sodium:solute symporter family protein, partial [Cyclobacteriaceae bacterium]|nr:sodium:solute symporter family protein [Cyclobacteriaceae bacterium]MDX5466979.1 sodium:solute symporter family protein [Cyclobacteriaceae bacterium]
QIFALGTELRSLLKGEDKRKMRITQLAILVFSLIVLVFSALISDELVLLARVSFAGTSMIAPVVLSAVIFQKPPKSILILSAIALSYFVLSLLEWVPTGFVGLPTDAAMYLILIPATAILMLVHHYQTKNIHAA